MKAKHTSGNWSISGIPGDNHVMAPRGHKRVSVAICVGWPGMPDEELQANKRLIRAAPEFLAACEEAEAELSMMVQVFGVGLKGTLARARCDSAKNTIAKCRALIEQTL